MGVPPGGMKIRDPLWRLVRGAHALQILLHHQPGFLPLDAGKQQRGATSATSSTAFAVRLIDGDHNGQAGGNAVAVIRKSAVTISTLALARVDQTTRLAGTLVDMVLDQV